MPLIRKDATPNGRPQEGERDQLATLSTGDADARWSAARALGASPEGVLALGRALTVEPDALVREAIFTSLARAATPESAAAVLPLLRSDDAELRTGALDALRAMPDAVRPQLGALLEDRDADVRLLACELVRGLPGPDAIHLLDALLEREGEANVCAAAVEGAGGVGDSSI